MRITRWLQYSISLVVVAGLAAGLYWRPINAAPSQPTPSTPVDDVLAHLGVVDIDRLVRAHPDFNKLEQIDQQISLLNAQVEAGGPSQDEIVKSMRKQLDEMKAKLVKKFQEDMTRMKADLDARKAGVEAQLKNEAASITGQLKAYQEELKRKAGAGPITVSPNADTKAKLEAELARSAEPLMLVARQKIAARQMEIQQLVDAQMTDSKRRLEQQVADQMDAVLRADQAQKLQLQLDMQTATDEDQRKKIQDQLARLNDKEEAKRAELRSSMKAQFDAEKQKAIGKHQAELQAYSAKVKADVDVQIRQRQAAVLSKYGVASAGQTKVSDLQAAMEMKQRELKAQFEARKNALVGGLQAASEAAQQKLKQEQKDIEKKLKAEQQRIIADAVKANTKLTEAEKARRTHLKGELDELKAQRERVYDGIVAQIRDNVRKLAEEQKVPLVVGDFRVNIKCQDLTELALKQAAGTAVNPGAPSGH